MLRYLFVMLVVLLLSAGTSFGVEIEEAVVTTAVVARQPVDEVEAFPAASGALYCFSRVVGAKEPTSVFHLWYRGEQLMSRVELPVRSPSWRTWSAKEFLSDWQGEWRVEIHDAEGVLLRTVKFVLK